MRLIRLGRKGNMVTSVSDRDYPALAKYNWSAVRITAKSSNGSKYTYGYKVGRRVGTNAAAKATWMHNQIMQPPKGMEVDHIDRNPLNNVRSNLRIVTHRLNCLNRSKRAGCTSKYYGVCRTIGKRRWSAIFTNPYGIKVHLGYFDTQTEAARAYDRAVKNAYGRYARTNF